jgi:hypothetical protein
MGWQKYWVGFLVLGAIWAIFFDEGRGSDFHADEIEWDDYR